MDVGFNNINFLHLALERPELEDVEWIVEANSTERFNLWQENHEKYDWKQASEGYGYTIIELNTSISKKSPFAGKNKSEVLPVNLDLSFAIINGHKICFYSSNSLLNHWGYINAFMHTYFQRTHDKYSRWNHVDAMNFHNCVGYLDTIDKEPRNTIYKGDSAYKEYYVFNPITFEQYHAKMNSKTYSL